MSFLHHAYPLGHLTALHSHPQAQYCYLHQGGGVITGCDGGGLLVAGQLCLIPAGWAHEFRVLRHSRLSLLYTPQSASTTFSQLQVSPMLAGLFARLPDLEEGDARDAYLKVLRHELGLAPPLAGQIPLAADLDPRLLRVLERLCQAPSVKVTLEALAVDCGASVRTLNRLFARQLGCSFRQWRERVLMGRARQLQHQGMVPAEIAGILGYEDPDAFSAALARVMSRGSAP
ncbi:helix-turn-helix domain-containing protein [Aeromonas media]|uniref:helix-turn-helix domain-containing protein n=1 Tax=Aeromonas media TaxID=651 RepID=UPI00223F59BB|nr:AraC family transcriptional regulator [Aeromonas media]